MNFYRILFAFILISLLSILLRAEDKGVLSLFKNKKPVIAALMIDRDLSSEDKIQKAIETGLKQIELAEKLGVDAILFEFRAGEILKPKITEKYYQAMLKIARSFVQKSQNVVIGFEVLWHYPEETLKLTKDSGGKFVRIDFFSDEVMAGKIKVPIDPQKILAYRKKIKAEDIFLLTDIQVKYSKMIDPKITMAQSAKKAALHHSDGLIVTATKSGEAPDPARFKQAKIGSPHLPIVIGSGFSIKNASQLLPHLDMIIVGTSISVKTGGPLVEKKVAELMKVVQEHRKTL